jgi:hypothetical protein
MCRTFAVTASAFLDGMIIGEPQDGRVKCESLLPFFDMKS